MNIFIKAVTFMKRNRKILKIAVTLGMLTLLCVKIDVLESISFFGRLDFASIGVIFLVTFWSIFVSVLKWQLFLKHLALPAVFWSLYRFYIIGYFFNNFLPSNIGGDAVRFTLTATGKKTYATSFVAVFMERLTGIVATLLFVSVSLPVALLKFEFSENAALVLLPTVVILAIIAVLFVLRPETFGDWSPVNPLLKKVRVKLIEILSSTHSFRNQKRVLFKAMLLSIAFNFLAILNVYVVAGALELSVDFVSLLILVPLILVISAIPLSINAIGIAEGAYVLCLSQVGLSVSAALSVALLMRAKTLVVSLLGGLFFLGYRKQHVIIPPADPESPSKHVVQ